MTANFWGYIRPNIMTTIKAFIKRHSVLIYYALTFAISWGGILLKHAGLKEKK
jgi:hypothetical protein